ncbi:MAG: DUF4979 domain-containing protein [Bacteroidales bacterium]|mgnify:CR=1 FL=1|nr:DUF4979 domain-containing protein [Bacteroidales bacterium]
MKHILKYTLGCLLLVSASMLIASCDDDDKSSDFPSAVYPQSVDIIIPNELQNFIYTDEALGINVLPMIKGESVILDYLISPDDVTFKDVNWTSSNENVAVVDEEGKVSAISGEGTGYAIIQVAPDPFFAGSNIFGTLKIIVDNSLIPAEHITINAPSDDVFAGETLQLTASISPENATYKTVKWTSSDESIATVSMNGLVTGIKSENNLASVTITATSLDNDQVFATKTIEVKQIIQPQDVQINQKYSVENGYLCAINEKGLTLDFTTVPTDATLSLIEWKSSNEDIATVNNGVITFNQAGVFGEVIISATCPETEKSSSIKLRLEEGLHRELFNNPDNYSWYNAAQSGNGTSSSHEWSEGKITVTTYKQNATNQRADLKCWDPKTWLHAGNYPIIAIRMDDAIDRPEVTSRNITLDASGDCNGQKFSGGLNGNNNKWLHDYKCSDGSHVFIYDLSNQKWANGGILPNNALATFTTFQFKYADIKELTSQITYNVYWVQTFKTIDDVKAYIESEDLTYEIIK